MGPFLRHLPLRDCRLDLTSFWPLKIRAPPPSCMWGFPKTAPSPDQLTPKSCLSSASVWPKHVPLSPSARPSPGPGSQRSSVSPVSSAPAHMARRTLVPEALRPVVSSCSSPGRSSPPTSPAGPTQNAREGDGELSVCIKWGLFLR